jgi:hypothetical protein
MQRRELVGLIGGAAAWPLAARAQQPGKIPVVGVLWHGSAEKEWANPFYHYLHDDFANRGYIANKTIRFEERYADERQDKYMASSLRFLGRATSAVSTKRFQRWLRPNATALSSRSKASSFFCGLNFPKPPCLIAFRPWDQTKLLSRPAFWLRILQLRKKGLPVLSHMPRESCMVKNLEISQCTLPRGSRLPSISRPQPRLI